MLKKSSCIFIIVSVYLLCRCDAVDGYITLLLIPLAQGKLRGCRYEIIEEMKEAVTKVIDTLTQEYFHEACQKLLERYNKCIATGGDYFEGD